MRVARAVKSDHEQTATRNAEAGARSPTQPGVTGALLAAQRQDGDRAVTRWLLNQADGAKAAGPKCGCGKPAGTGGCAECRAKAAKAGGGPLEPSVREDMEEGFGEDFSAVRVHKESEAATAAGATAYTLGED